MVFPKYEISKLQSVQNAAARVIACLLSKFDHISDTLKELHWLPERQRGMGGQRVGLAIRRPGVQDSL